MNDKMITIVSGLPRSGTSMMMMMLQAGGMAVLTDNIRQADDDNPKGYYEFERVKGIEHDKEWLPLAHGKVVKMISVLLRHLPDEYQYKVIFMRRKMEEILASQRKMLIRRGEDPDAVSDEKIAEASRKHLQKVDMWLSEQEYIDVLYVRYSDVLTDSRAQATRISRFLDDCVDPKRMAQAVDERLYHQRA
jgi:hypothetical protein